MGADYGNKKIFNLEPDGTISLTAFPSFAGNPSHIISDGNGGYYVADFSLNVVRQLFPPSASTIIAGVSTSYGSAGDGGPATLALLFNPTAAMPDGAGGVFIADFGNYALRHVLPASQCYQLGSLFGCVGINTSFILCTITGMDDYNSYYFFSNLYIFF